MQPCRWLVEDVERSASCHAAQFPGELDALGSVAALVGLRRGGKDPAYLVKDASVGSRVGTGCAPYRVLRDVDDLVQLPQTIDIVMWTRCNLGVMQCARQGRVQRAVNEAALAAATHTRDAGHQPQREAHIDVLEVVHARSHDGQPVAGWLAALPAVGCNDRQFS